MSFTSSAKPSMSHWSTLMKTGHITIRTSSQATPLRQMTSRSMGTQHCTVARRYISNPQVIPRTFHLVGQCALEKAQYLCRLLMDGASTVFWVLSYHMFLETFRVVDDLQFHVLVGRGFLPLHPQMDEFQLQITHMKRDGHTHNHKSGGCILALKL